MESTDFFFPLNGMFNYFVYPSDTEILHWLNDEDEVNKYLFFKLQNKPLHHLIIHHNMWLEQYEEVQFYEFFKFKKATFHSLHKILIEKDKRSLISKSFRGGRYPIDSKKSLLMFLLYMTSKETLLEIAERFGVVPSTVLKIINGFLYLVLQLKHIYITWPTTEEELEAVKTGFKSYPNTIGAVDGTHIEIKVPVKQQDYLNRKMKHSINLMAVYSKKNILIRFYWIFCT